MYIKKFTEWLGLKKKVHEREHQAPLVKEFEIYWVNMGINIGSEIDGKSKSFTRPGIIFKKLAHSFYLIAPTTTQKKEGNWYVPVVHGGKEMYVCLHQIRAVDYRRLQDKIGQVDDVERDRIKAMFKDLYCP